MLVRETFGWRVTLADAASGATHDREIHNYWSPDWPDAQDAIGKTAAAEAYVEHKKRTTFIPATVVRL